MKASAPEKLYIALNELTEDGRTFVLDHRVDYPICTEYTRTDAFIEKALKWYCLDCECNDNCKDTKCYFYRRYERYLKGDDNAIPPKFSDRILNEDGSTSDNWRYRHFIVKMQDAFIEKACDAYCKVCGHYAHTVPTHICRHDCRYYSDFKKAMKL